MLFKLYLSKLNPKRNDLWQKPKAFIIDPVNQPWYENQVVGRDPLNSTMKDLSKHAHLSRIYTNHCIRAWTVTQLDTQGFEARHIMAVSGHKSENSIKNYSSVCPDTKKREMFDALAKNMKQDKINENPPGQLPPEVNKLTTEQFEILPLFPDMADDPLENENILQIIDKIEKENSNLQVPNTNVTKVQKPQTPPRHPGPGLLVSNNLQHNFNQMIQNVNRGGSPFPNMFFPTQMLQ